LDPPRTPQPRASIYYRPAASGSTPHFKSPHELNSESDSEDESGQIDVGFSLSQFPTPPRPPMPRRRMPPKPLVLLPTPSIAPLPPSPLLSSGESTPVATPTTPRYTEPCMRKGILKKPSSCSIDPTTPTTPTSPPRRTLPEVHSHTPPPRLRSAQSVPHFQPLALANAHRLTSSDIIPTTNRRRVASRPDPHVAHEFYSKAPLPPPPRPSVQYGYAV